MLSNESSREPTLSWIALVIRYNEKRCMINVEWNLVASDIFFLNLVAVMHLLSLQIKLEEVDVFYPFHPKGRLTAGVARDTKIRVYSQEHMIWIEGLQQNPDHVWKVLYNIPSVLLFYYISCINNTVYSTH